MIIGGHHRSKRVRSSAASDEYKGQEPYLVFLAITLSLLVSYTRSRAESLGVKLQGVGIGERAERLLVIAIIGIIGFMEYAIIIVIIIAAITFIQRIVVTTKALRE